MSDTESESVSPIPDKVPETTVKVVEEHTEVNEAVKVESAEEPKTISNDKSDGAGDAKPASNTPAKPSSEPKNQLLGGFKIKKRTITTAESENSAPSPKPKSSGFGFSRRSRNDDGNSRSGTPLDDQRSSTDSYIPNGSSASSAYSRSRGRDTYEPPSKFKRPSRRGDIEYQSRIARQERECDEGDERRIEEEIRMKRQNLDNVVRNHYNERTFIAKGQKRNLSPIIKLRNFNNVIKNMLINGAVSGPGARVLDLGCGKGGDLRKWETARISQYIGVDISNASIVEAMRRYHNNRAPYEVTFVTGDAFGLPLPVVLRDFPEVFSRFPLDVVTMQFCLHYAFESEAKARMTIENVARSLKPGGQFIGTIPNSEFIASKIRHLPPGSKSFGNSIYSVTFEDTPPKSGEFENPYGNVYNYYLKDAIDNVPEYVIQFEDLRALADEFGLRLKFKKSFAEYFREQIPAWYKRLSPNVLDGIKRSDGSVGVERDEAEAAAQFYVAFAFIKAG